MCICITVCIYIYEYVFTRLLFSLCKSPKGLNFQCHLSKYISGSVLRHFFFFSFIYNCCNSMLPLFSYEHTARQQRMCIPLRCVPAVLFILFFPHSNIDRYKHECFWVYTTKIDKTIFEIWFRSNLLTQDPNRARVLILRGTRD